MGMRGNKHKFMPNRLVFPGGRVDRADLTAQPGAPLAPHTERNLRRSANPDLARGLGIAAARELEEETGLVLADAPGAAPRLDRLWYLARAVTPPTNPIRYNARFLTAAGAGAVPDLARDVGAAADRPNAGTGAEKGPGLVDGVGRAAPRRAGRYDVFP
jgi:8-oxo-dGTP pyrophosphatase MutT (NUDIX family)